MYPVIHHGDKILVKKVFTPKKNDIIVCINPEENKREKYLIKRITMIKNARYFVLGDNTKESIDSRKFGWIDKKLLIGKMIFKLPARKNI